MLPRIQDVPSVPPAGRAGDAGTLPPVLDVQDLRTFFPTDAGTVRAVNGVSFVVREGETLAIVGESGSGKSVTGLTIMRLLGRAGAQITGGEIWLTRADGNRVDLARLPDADMERLRGSEIAMIFQDPMSSLNPVFPVGEQIAEPLRLHKGLSRRAARAAAVELLALVGLSGPARQVDAFPHQLSGGMRQRIMIAIALACEPRLLIADEPTTALDVTVQAQIIALLRELQVRRRMAMIFVTHDLHLVGDVADRVAVMYASQVVEEGPVADVLATPAHPYTRALLACVPRQQRGETRRRMTPIPGTMPSALAVPSGCRFHPRCAHAAARCIEAVPTLEAIAPDRRARCVRWREIGP